MLLDQTQKNHLDPVPCRLDLCSMRRLESSLDYPRQQIVTVARKAGAFYDPFNKRARRPWFPKKPPPAKVRKIDNPIGPLKEIQTRIQKHILRDLVLPHYLCGGVRGKTIFDATKVHFRARVVVKLDIKDFFPSISNIQVYKVWRDLLRCSPRIAALLTKLTTYERHLPQGAPTSTILANLVLYCVDEPIRSECARRGVTYSSWIDDLAFSGEDSRHVIQTAVGALRTGGFAVSRRKLKIMGPGDRKLICGILMGKSPGVARERISNLRSGIHKLRTGQVPLYILNDYLRSLEGAVRHVAAVNPKQGQKLLQQLKVAAVVSTLPPAPSR